MLTGVRHGVNGVFNNAFSGSLFSNSFLEQFVILKNTKREKPDLLFLIGNPVGLDSSLFHDVAVYRGQQQVWCDHVMTFFN
jgi:hypothetical protein